MDGAMAAWLTFPHFHTHIFVLVFLFVFDSRLLSLLLLHSNNKFCRQLTIAFPPNSRVTISYSNPKKKKKKKSPQDPLLPLLRDSVSLMGSGDWFKTIISSKKVKDDRLKQWSQASARSNGFKWKSWTGKGSTSLANGSTVNTNTLDVPAEELAATHIQTAFRAYMARKALRHLKGIVRLQALTQNYSVKRQTVNTLNCLHSWSKIQAEIRARRLCMVTEGRLRQKKLENQLKFEAKLHELEVEWCGGAETMEEALARIHLREEAGLKRERAMAYAFSHQWRANSNQNVRPVNYEPGKANWGWSWKERWIAARPWESRVPAKSTVPKKVQNKQANKGGQNSNSPAKKTPVSSKPSVSNKKGTIRARRLTYPIAEKRATFGGSIKAEEAKAKTEQLVS